MSQYQIKFHIINLFVYIKNMSKLGSFSQFFKFIFKQLLEFRDYNKRTVNHLNGKHGVSKFIFNCKIWRGMTRLKSPWWHFILQNFDFTFVLLNWWFYSALDIAMSLLCPVDAIHGLLIDFSNSIYRSNKHD